MKFLASLMALILSALVTIWVMQVGWGLTAKSWAVIIWGIVFHILLLCVSIAASKDDDK